MSISHTLYFKNYNHELLLKEPGLHQIGKSLLSSATFTLEEKTIVQLSCGSKHSAVVCDSGRVLTFGENGRGQLGLVSNRGTFVSKPTLVSTLISTPVSQVACGEEFALFLLTSGDLYGCGANNYHQLGLKNSANNNLPTKLSGIPPIKMIAAGGWHSVLVAVSGQVLVAGYNGYGQLGLGSITTQAKFTIVSSVCAQITSISCSDYNTALVTSTGVLFVAGYNGFGQLGLGDKCRSSTFQQVSLPSAVVAVDSGESHTVALTIDGAVWAWGSNKNCELGIPELGASNAISLTHQMMTRCYDVVKKVVAGWGNTALINQKGYVLLCGDLFKRFGDVNKWTTVPKPEQLVVNEVAIAKTYIIMVAVQKSEAQPPLNLQSLIPESLNPERKMLPTEKAIMKALECPICLKVMCATICQCTAGHSVCSTCRYCTTNCPICRRPYSAARNFALESLRADILLPCTICWQRLPTNLLEEHLSVCQLKLK